MLSSGEIGADARRVAAIALAEDGPFDITSESSIPAAQRGTATIVARDATVLAGTAWVDAVVARCGLGPVDWHRLNGDPVQVGAAIGTVAGGVAALLRAERPALNLLQRACAVAALTRRFVELLAGTGCTVLHTRKTTPGLRLFEIAAVMAGGGGMHRQNLTETVLLKDNHWRAMRQSGRSVAMALDVARGQGATGLIVEVEEATQVAEASLAGATRLLIDNQSPALVREWGAVARRLRPGIEIEASGGITLGNALEYARAGADYVSVGALTTGPPVPDLALDVAGEAIA